MVSSVPTGQTVSVWPMTRSGRPRPWISARRWSPSRISTSAPSAASSLAIRSATPRTPGDRVGDSISTSSRRSVTIASAVIACAAGPRRESRGQYERDRGPGRRTEGGRRRFTRRVRWRTAEPWPHRPSCTQASSSSALSVIDEPQGIYRGEVLAIMGALADIYANTQGILALLNEDGEDDEESEEMDS